MSLPKMVRVKQLFPRISFDDVREAVQSELVSIGIESIIKSGDLTVPKGMTKNEFISKREKEIQKLQGASRFETKYTNGAATLTFGS